MQTTSGPMISPGYKTVVHPGLGRTVAVHMEWSFARLG